MAEKAKDPKETVAASAEAAKTEASKASQNLTDTVFTQVKGAADSAMSRGIEAAQTLLHNVDEKKGEVSSRLVDALKGATTTATTGGGDSTTGAATDDQRSRELPVSTDNQPLVASGQGAAETTPWWKNCCGVLDLLNPSSR